MGNIFVIVEHRQGIIREVTLEMLSAATAVASQMDGKTIAVLLDNGNEKFVETLQEYCDEILNISNTCFENYNAGYYQKAVVSLAKSHTPDLIMVGHTAQGVDFGPNIAVELKTSLITDVIGMTYQDGQLNATRQYFQGKVNAEFTAKGPSPFVVTVRESCFSIDNPGKTAQLTKVESDINESSSFQQFIEYIEAEASDLDITKSDVLIAVGRGIEDEENLDIIEDLAQAIGADICGSRVAVDSGWISKDRQVGISGKRVNPKLYMAIGVSGAFQHLVGMSGAKTIVAINKDPGAPIFSVASYAIVGDLFEVVPNLTDQFKELLS